MEQPKIRSSKGVTLAQMVCCLVLILVVCVSSFGTIFTVGFEMDDYESLPETDGPLEYSDQHQRKMETEMLCPAGE